MQISQNIDSLMYHYCMSLVNKLLKANQILACSVAKSYMYIPAVSDIVPVARM